MQRLARANTLTVAEKKKPRLDAARDVALSATTKTKNRPASGWRPEIYTFIPKWRGHEGIGYTSRPLKTVKASYLN